MNGVQTNLQLEIAKMNANIIQNIRYVPLRMADEESSGGILFDYAGKVYRIKETDETVMLPQIDRETAARWIAKRYSFLLLA